MATPSLGTKCFRVRSSWSFLLLAKTEKKKKMEFEKKIFFRAIFLFRWDGGDVEEVVRGPGLRHHQLVRRDWHRCPNYMSLWCLKVVKWIILKWQFLQALQIQVGLLPWKWRSLPTATGQASHRPSGKAAFTFLSKSPTRIAPSSPSSSQTRREARRRRSRRPSPRRWRRSKRLFWRKQLLSWRRKRGVQWRRTRRRKVRWNWNWILPPCLPPRLRHLLANPSDFLVSRKCYQIVTRGKCKLCVQIVWKTVKICQLPSHQKRPDYLIVKWASCYNANIYLLGFSECPK